MPIISKVNAHSWQGKTIFGIIFVILILGAITMIYPFLLMLAGSLHSEADAHELTILPSFWKDDQALFRKYTESKYGDTRLLHEIWGRRIPSFRSIKPPAEPGHPYLEDYLAWRAEAPWWEVGHVLSGRILAINARLYRQKMYEQFDKNIEAYALKMKIPVQSWNQVAPPGVKGGRFRTPDIPLFRDWYAWAEKRPLADRYTLDHDAKYAVVYAMAKYTPSIEVYNQRHGTSHTSYDDLVLATRASEVEGLEREDWEDYVRNEIQLQYINLDPSLAPNYRAFIEHELYANIDEYNARFGTAYSAYEDIPFSKTVPLLPVAQVDWEEFIKDEKACLVDQISIKGARHFFEEFVAKRRGVPVKDIAPIRIPAMQVDYHDLMNSRKEWRAEFIKRNYLHVMQFVLRHGHGIKNTIIYCLLAIGTALLVNPLASYALSRYKPPSMYKILLFCMATMAFPGEVTMIPGFLLLKRFPLWPILGGLAVFILAAWVFNRYFKKTGEPLRMIIALVLGIIAGAWVIPKMTGQTNVSLLNTFWALVIPGAANGFFIFLLKGFFDSLPQELFEQAEIDGAGEWTKFWTITMNLSKPILAVIALQAFVGAYSAFMMALIIIPDKDMWTLMVWVFQLQTEVHQGVLYASLVITAIPTFMVFAFCQNIIIRGIVVPVEK